MQQVKARSWKQRSQHKNGWELEWYLEMWRKERATKGWQGEWHLSLKWCFSFLDTETFLQKKEALLFCFHFFHSNKPVVSPFIPSTTKQGNHYRHCHVQDQHGHHFRKIFRKMRKIEMFVSETYSGNVTFKFTYSKIIIWYGTCSVCLKANLYILYYWDWRKYHHVY